MQFLNSAQGIEPVFVMFFFLAMFGTLALLEYRQQKSWRETARSLGLKLSGFLTWREMKGRLDDFPVRLGYLGQQRKAMEIEVECWGKIPENLSLTLERLITQLIRGQDTQTGDSEFDQLIRLAGDPLELVSLLDAGTRRLVIKNIRDEKIQLNNGRMTYQLGGHLFSGIDDAIPHLRMMVNFGKALALKPDEIPERLARNATTDPVIAVRLRNLEMLQEQYPDNTLTVHTCRTVVAGDNPVLQLAAARFLGPEGKGTIRHLAAQDSLDAGLRRQALQIFLQLAPAEEAVPVLEELLPSAPQTMIAVIIEGAVRFESRRLLEQLLNRAENLTGLDTVHLIESISLPGDTGFENSLLKLMERPEPAVQMAAIRALGQTGSTRSVEPLLELARGLLVSPGLKRAAGEAVRQIQARLGSAESGRLYLADEDDQAGSLSLAEGSPPGALNLTPDASSRSTLRPSAREVPPENPADSGLSGSATQPRITNPFPEIIKRPGA